MNVTNTQSAGAGNSGQQPDGFPAGCELFPVVIVAERNSDQQLLLELPFAFQKFAVQAKSGAVSQADSSGTHFEFLTIPATNHQDADLQQSARDWVDAISPDSDPPPQMLTLQGAQIFWNQQRVAVLAAADRLPTLRAALIEAFWYDAELTDLERALGEAWPKMDNDMPLAFSFDEKALARRSELQENFEQITAIRSRHQKLSPHVYCPHLHPPTLASQVGERFRERTRLSHRHEILGEQLEVFERIYDACAQRASDFSQSRTGHLLEWGIIVILLAQTLFWIFEILTNIEPTMVGQ